jgi:putative transposase
MKQQPATPTYKRHRFPPELISYSVWLYFRFALSYRDVEELLAERGVIVTYETIRQWCREVRPGLCERIAPTTPAPWR